MGAVPIAHFLGDEFATRKATQIVGGARFYCARYAPVSGTRYDDHRVVCWGDGVEALGLGLSTDSNGQAKSMDIAQSTRSRGFVDLNGNMIPGFEVTHAKPIEVSLGEGVEVLSLEAMHSAVCARVIDSAVAGDTVLVRCWGDWDNLKVAGMLAPQLSTDSYANRNQAADMTGTTAGPPYLWLGKGWGWTAADFSSMTSTGFSVQALGASKDGLGEELGANLKYFSTSSGPQVTCIAAEADESISFRGGVACFQEVPLPGQATQPGQGGTLSSSGPFPASVTVNQFLQVLSSADGSGNMQVHGLAVTAVQSCVLYSTDATSRALKCWGDTNAVPALRETDKQLANIEGAGIAG